MSVEGVLQNQSQERNKEVERALNEFNELVKRGRELRDYREAWVYFRNLPPEMQRIIQNNPRSWYKTLRISGM